MKKLLLVLAALGYAAALCNPAQARVFRWVDNKGVVHYSDRIPPDAGSEQTELSKKGRVVKVLEAPAAKTERENKDVPAVDPKVAEQARQRDLALLNTFASVAELERARDERLGQIDGKIQAGKTRLEALEQSIEKLETRIARADKELPKDYQLNLDSLKKNRDVARAALNRDYAQRRQIEASFDADLVRLRELKETAAP